MQQVAMGWVLIASLACFLGPSPQAALQEPPASPSRSGETRPARTKRIPSEHYEAREVEGWTVRVNRRLLNEEAELGKKALRLLEFKLYQICRVVPQRPLAKYRSP